MAVKISKLAWLGLCTALAMVFSFIESLVPPVMPGVKLGLPNVAIVFLLYWMGTKQAIAVSGVRIVLVSILFGSPLSLAYSLAGGALSLAAMIGLKKTGLFSCVTVSVVGGVCHNIAQVAVACFVTATQQLVYLLPVLLLSGTVAGVLIGLLAGVLVKRLDRLKPF